MKEACLLAEFLANVRDLSALSSVSDSLAKEGVDAILVPPNAHRVSPRLLVPVPDYDKTVEKLKRAHIKTRKKVVIFLLMENKPGVIAEVSRPIAEQGINVLYAFGFSYPPASCLIVETTDNAKALSILLEQKKNATKDNGHS